MNTYCEGALDYLAHAHDPERALFSFNSVLGPAGEIVNDFDHPQTHRYTINTYLGLREAERHGGDVPWLGPVDAAVRRYVDQHYEGLDSHADLGLLCVLLADVDPGHPAVGRSLEQMAEAVRDPDAAARRFNLQDLAWMLWGAAATTGDDRAEPLARNLFALIRSRFVDERSGLARHSVARWRANLVSFGSTVYFLRAMYEHATRFGDEEARRLFVEGARKVMAIQGPEGEWPWMIDTRTAVPVDLYPVFTVHQDSMAMLWLFPAAQLGVEGVAEAIDCSFAWNLGRNELGTSLVCHEPCFWVYRAVERDERFGRVRRYVRSLGRPATRYPSRSAKVRINRECRSYHLGWVLYVWSSQAATPHEDAGGVTAARA
ncbi:MAG TPA: hypothetical protein VFT50_10385 [Baekduia sp.]|nr:hypothetical protein [Baekduia sp.]